MSLVLQSSGGGSVTIAEPTTASDFTQTLPAADGVTMVSGNMPAFSATRTSSQTFTTSTFTKLQFNTETFDTNSNYDPTTNYRFTPSVEGYYQINGNVSFEGATVGWAQIAIYKNGSSYVNGSGIINNNNIGGMVTVSTVVYLNGSTDYVELYAWQNSGGDLGLQTADGRNTFSGAMVRAA
jgi:hypothetical protein